VDEMEKELAKCQDSFIVMRVESYKSRLHLLQLGEKFIELDNWQDERFNEVIALLYHDLTMKEEALKEL
jgi:hypothetical protein